MTSNSRIKRYARAGRPLLFALSGLTVHATGAPAPFGPIDYSYAGYALHPDSIGESEAPAFAVGDFGAVPDDDASDRDAVQAAIDAAVAAGGGGGVVSFASGVYLLNEQPGGVEGLHVAGPGVVLRGVRQSGGGAKPTVLFMRHHLEPTDPKKMWTTPPLFGFSAPENARRPGLTRLTADAPQGALTVAVENASKIRVGDFVTLEMQNPAANAELLAGLEPWDIWSKSNAEGIAVRERHRVAAVEGTTVTITEPLHLDVRAAWGWEVKASPLSAGWTVEDLTFRGDYPEPFVHHKNAMHDSGWSMLRFNRGLAPVLRRCRFVNVTSAASFNDCYAATAIDNVLEGRQGHSTLSSDASSYGTLIAFCRDETRRGGFHGFGANAGAVGTVIHRCKNSDRGFDWHASGPYATLIDACTGGLIGNGGYVALLPNHLQGLTFWNFRQTSGPAYDRLDWWEPRRGDEQYSGPKIVLPRVVGYHGIATTFDPKHCLSIESHGRPVEPASLFAAQLADRVDALPRWMTERSEP